MEVWEPFARNNQVDFAATGWAYKIGQADYRDVVESDGIFAVVNGVPPDEGVMVELGMAIALKKPTFLFRGRLPERERQWRISPKFDVVHRNAAGGVAGLLLHVDRRDRVAGEGPCSVGAKLKTEAFE